MKFLGTKSWFPFPFFVSFQVHNIVLYPDKHSWCKKTEIKQIVAYPGCSSIEIDNNVCVGACFSYSIPRTIPSAPGEVIIPYCDSCQPVEYEWREVRLNIISNSYLIQGSKNRIQVLRSNLFSLQRQFLRMRRTTLTFHLLPISWIEIVASFQVTLTCSDESEEDEGQTEMTKRVQVIKNCSCTSCDKQYEEKKLPDHQKHIGRLYRDLVISFLNSN